MFDIRVESDGRVIFSGRLDAAQVAKADKILSRLDQSVTADLSDLDYISSAGIGMFVKAQLRLRAAGHAIRIVNLHPRVKDIFHYSGLEETFGID
jgi:anti-sigma B factor antagonist